ncbi:hypothetical protein CsSME_00043774 [Camellia sinensis var. sinensis]
MLLSDLHISVPSPTLWCDNISGISLSSNLVFYKVVVKQLKISHILTSDQLADILTKPLSNQSFHYLQSKLMVLPASLSLRGHVKPELETELKAELKSQAKPQMQSKPKSRIELHQL